MVVPTFPVPEHLLDGDSVDSAFVVVSGAGVAKSMGAESLLDRRTFELQRWRNRLRIVPRWMGPPLRRRRVHVTCRGPGPARRLHTSGRIRSKLSSMGTSGPWPDPRVPFPKRTWIFRMAHARSGGLQLERGSLISTQASVITGCGTARNPSRRSELCERWRSGPARTRRTPPSVRCRRPAGVDVESLPT